EGFGVGRVKAMRGLGALMNGGYLIPPTFRKRTEQEATVLATRVIKPDTSEKMRYLMRLNVEKGTATKAEVDGFYVGGKTGTAEKVVAGGYSQTKAPTNFTPLPPAAKPPSILLLTLHEPRPP